MNRVRYRYRFQPHVGDGGNGSIKVIVRQIDVTRKAEPVLIEHDDGCDEAWGIMPYHAPPSPLRNRQRA